MAGSENDYHDTHSEKTATHHHHTDAPRWLGEDAFGLTAANVKPEGGNRCLQAGVGVPLHLDWCAPPERPIEIPGNNLRPTISPPVLFQFKF